MRRRAERPRLEVASTRPAVTLSPMGPLLRALGDDTRLEIVEKLALAGDATVDELAVDLGLPPASFSRHLKVLLDAGVVRADRRGAWIFYSLDLLVLARLADLIARVVTLRSMGAAGPNDADG